MKPFNLKAAQQGKPIQDGLGHRLHYIGIDSLGYVIIEHGPERYVRYTKHGVRSDEWGRKANPKTKLYMAPKLITVYVRIYMEKATERTFCVKVNKLDDPAINQPLNPGFEWLGPYEKLEFEVKDKKGK